MWKYRKVCRNLLTINKFLNNPIRTKFLEIIFLRRFVLCCAYMCVGVNCTCNINYIWGAWHDRASKRDFVNFFVAANFSLTSCLVYVVNKSQLNEHETISIFIRSPSLLLKMRACALSTYMKAKCHAMRCLSYQHQKKYLYLKARKESWKKLWWALRLIWKGQKINLIIFLYQK